MALERDCTSIPIMVWFMVKEFRLYGFDAAFYPIALSQPIAAISVAQLTGSLQTPIV
jgi:hypothetical protein